MQNVFRGTLKATSIFFFSKTTTNQITVCDVKVMAPNPEIIILQLYSSTLQRLSRIVAHRFAHGPRIGRRVTGDRQA